MALSISRAAFRGFISVAWVVTALPVRPATLVSASWLGMEKQLTKRTKLNHGPDISDTLVVYSDFRHARDLGDPEDPDTLFDIRVLDLRTGKERIITPKHSASSEASISGNRVVWTDYGNGTSTLGIWYHNLSTGTHKGLASGWQPTIEGTHPCYFRKNRIYVYNLTTRKEKAVSPKGVDDDWCDISGTKVIYDRCTGAGDVDVYPYAPRTITRLTEAIGDVPAVWSCVASPGSFRRQRSRCLRHVPRYQIAPPGYPRGERPSGILQPCSRWSRCEYLDTKHHTWYYLCHEMSGNGSSRERIRAAPS